MSCASVVSLQRGSGYNAGMRSAFIALVVTNACLLAATAGVGGLVDGDRWFGQHFALGLVATVFTCFAHCAVFTYFMATSTMMALAVEDAGLNPALAADARQLKRRAFRVVMPSVAAAGLAAFAGAWATIRPDVARLHLVAALASCAVQLWAWWTEYAIILANRNLMNAVFEQHHHAKGQVHEVGNV